MRILHLIPSFGQGGAERQLALLASALFARPDVDLQVAFHTCGVNALVLNECPSVLSELRMMDNHDPRMVWDIRRACMGFRPDIIQTWLPQMDVLGGLVARWMGIPHVLSERSSAAMYTAGGWKNRLRVAIGKRAQVIIANSEGGLDYWRRQGARGRLHVVRNALTPPSPEPAPLAQLGLEGRKLLVAAGRLSHEKNVSVVVQAMAVALAKLPEHHGVIFGEGPERKAILALIAATGLSGRIHMGGYSSNLYGWLRAADVFLSASLMEGHPNVVIEAAAAGCPLVLSDIPAHREFAVGGSALFATATDATLLAEAVVQSATNRKAAMARAEHARALTQPLSVEAAALRHIEIYRSLLNEPKHS